MSLIFDYGKTRDDPIKSSESIKIPLAINQFIWGKRALPIASLEIRDNKLSAQMICDKSC